VILRCHTCGNVQRDRRVYRDHLLRAHGEVSHRGLDAPVRLPDRELAAVWASVRRHQTSGNTRASRRREELCLPSVSDRKAERRLRDNRSRTARRHRAAARARRVATATLGAPDVQGVIEIQGAAPREPAKRLAACLGSFQVRPQGEPVLTVREGGPRNLSPPATCAATASVRRTVTTARPRTHARRLLAALLIPVASQHPPAVAHRPDVVTPARPSRTCCPAHLSCGARRPSRKGRPPRTKGALPGTRPRSSLALEPDP